MNLKLIKELKEKINTLLTHFAEVSTVDGKILVYEVLESGNTLQMVDEAGEVVLAPEGVYETETQKITVDANSVIVSVEDKVVVEEKVEEKPEVVVENSETVEEKVEETVEVVETVEETTDVKFTETIKQLQDTITKLNTELSELKKQPADKSVSTIELSEEKQVEKNLPKGKENAARILAAKKNN